MAPPEGEAGWHAPFLTLRYMSMARRLERFNMEMELMRLVMR